MRRTIIIGDIHGCADELDDLLDAVAFTSGDRLISVGDIVVRGPYPGRSVRRLRELGAQAVRGNHEDRLLRRRAKRFAGHDPEKTPGWLAKLVDEAIDELSAADINWLVQLPYWLRLEEHGMTVTHAGVVPGTPLERQSAKLLMNLRGLSDELEPLTARDTPVWGARYAGDVAGHVVFGHNAMRDVQVHAFATGIDTGCVYGGTLTAMVLPAGAAVPDPQDRRDALTRVPARHTYVPVE